MTLAASLYNWLLFVHVLAAMVWLGGAALIAVLATRTLRSDDVAEIGRFVANLRLVAPLLAAPPALLLGAGIWMVLKNWRFGDGWVALGVALFAVAALVGALFQNRAATAAERAAAAGDGDTARHFLRHWSWGIRLILLLLVVTTWDMVLKPGL